MIEKIRVPLDDRAIADLVMIKPPDSDTTLLDGIFLRRYNDYVPLKLFDSSVEVNRISHVVTDGSLHFSALNVLQTKFVELRSPECPEKVVQIPLVSNELPPNCFSIELNSTSRHTMHLLSLGEGSSSICIQQPDVVQNDHVLDASQGCKIPLRPDTVMIFFCTGGAYNFYVGIRCISCDPQGAEAVVSAQGIVDIKFRGNSARFFVFMEPDEHEQFVGGKLTVGFSMSDIAVAIYKPYMAAMFQYLASAVSGAAQTPVMLPARKYPTQLWPHLVLGCCEGWYMPISDAAGRSLSKASKAVLIGTPPINFIRSALSGNRFSLVALVTKDKDCINTVSKFVASSTMPTPDTPLWLKSHKPIVVLLHLQNTKKLMRTLERLFDELTELESQGKSTSGIDLTIDHSGRLPPLPHSTNLAVAMVSTVANTFRGRLPADDDQSRSPYDFKAFTDNALWPVAWDATVELSQAGIIEELNLRLCAEFIAARAAVDIRAYTEESPGVALKRGEDSIAQAFWEWQSRGRPKHFPHVGAVSHWLREGDISEETFGLELNKAAYAVCKGIGPFADADPRSQGMFYANPLVVILATGGSDLVDDDLSLNAAFWSLFTGRIAGAVPAAIAPTLHSHLEINTARKIDAKLVSTLRVEPLDRKSVYKLRQKLGRALDKLLCPSVFRLEKRLSPSRIVTFSDIPLDLVPLRSSVLGMEVPVSRFPASGPAYQSVWAFAQATKHELQSKQALSIATFSAGDDSVSQWAKEASSKFQDIMTFSGCPIKELGASEDPARRIAESSIIAFFGHAGPCGRSHGLMLSADKFYTAEQMREQDWTHRTVFLFGCETAVGEGMGTNLAETALLRGARAVIATETTVSIPVIDVFFREFFEQMLGTDLQIDYAFFHARRKAVLFEAIARVKPMKLALESVKSLLKGDDVYSMKLILTEAKLTWAQVMERAPYALSLTLYGGTGQRLL